MEKFRAKIYIFPFLFLLIFSSVTWALDFSIRPIRIFISNGKTTGVFEIRSLTDKKIALETEVKRWDQDEDGNFILTDTEEMLVVPPYIELEGGQRQLVRVAYLGGFESGKQEFFRLFVRELPKDIKETENPEKVRTSIQVLLNLSVPIFVTPKGLNPVYKVKLVDAQKSEKIITLRLKNIGNGFAKIIGIELYKDEEKIFSTDASKYILPDRSILLKVVNIKLNKDKKPEMMPFKDIPNKIKLIMEDDKEIIFNI
ncbi:fimbria/pilus periplasmic chaperone [Persephonella sp.]|uniref:fimbrial biogenesis chaperone n=1 Tax=Persephonella sp. TaxID=2060922 RepID=UPI0025CE6BB8|nr:fimbria/pilus periplasmic chaperone [Persephonella sp.]